MIDGMFPVDRSVEIDPESLIDEELIEAIFLIAVYCSLGATIVSDARLDFDTYIKKQCSKMGIDDKQDLVAQASNYKDNKISKFKN